MCLFQRLPFPWEQIKKVEYIKLFWIFFSVVLLIFSVFPKLAEIIASALGIVSAVNFIFLFIIFLLLINQYQLTVRLSKLDTKFKNLVQTIALRGKDE